MHYTVNPASKRKNGNEDEQARLCPRAFQRAMGAAYIGEVYDLLEMSACCSGL